MLRARTSAVLAGLLCAAVLAGCGSSGSDESEPTVVGPALPITEARGVNIAEGGAATCVDEDLAVPAPADGRITMADTTVRGEDTDDGLEVELEEGHPFVGAIVHGIPADLPSGELLLVFRDEDFEREVNEVVLCGVEE